MFKRLMSVIEGIEGKQRKRFNEKIESFNDPIANKIKWSPLGKVSSNFTTRKMVKFNEGNIRFLPSISSVVFSAFFIGMGSYVMWISSLYRTPVHILFLHPIQWISNYLMYLPEFIASKKIWGQAFGLVFFLMGTIHLIVSLRPISFNLGKRIYSKNYFNKHRVPFEDIHAIQLIYKSGGQGAGSPGSYELNLVLKNAERLHVLGQSKTRVIRRNANEISKLLSIPIWDMTQLYPNKANSRVQLNPNRWDSTGKVDEP